MRPPTLSPTPRDLAVFAAIRTHRRLTASQLRRLFFRGADGNPVAIQTVHARLRRLTGLGYLDTVTVDRGRGSGPYAYGLTPRGLHMTGAPPRRRGHPGPLWHDLQVAEFRVNLELGLEERDGRLVEWVGEGDLRSLLRGSNAPRPDGLAHWQLDGREGAILIEHDSGTEPFATLTAKLNRYATWLRDGSHRRLLPGLGLRPQLAFVAPRTRAARLVSTVRSRPTATTVFVGIDNEVVPNPLACRWWRDDARKLQSLLTRGWQCDRRRGLKDAVVG
jgi:Replication-relaxation